MQTVADVMTPFVRTVRTTQPIAAVRDLMVEESLHAVPIVDEYGELCGIVSSSDLLEGWSPTESVEHAMNRDVRTIAPDIDVAAAAHEMLSHGLHHLVVSTGGEMVGMLSSWDLLRSLARTVQEMTAVGYASPPIEAGDDLVVFRPDGSYRAHIAEVCGPDGHPPYAVTWYDDPEGVRYEVSVEHRDDVVLDGCER